MPETFVWSSPDGYSLVRRILKTTAIPYEPHDYQLEGVCKSLDGISLFAITPTGSGKTSYYIIYMLVVLAVIKDPTLCPSAKFPENPCLVIICPTIPLQMEMAENMRALGLDPLAINSETRSEAQRCRNEDLWVTARTKPNVVLTGPEQLKSDDFEKALRDDKFYDRICGTGFDEVHLLNTWGASFRKDFAQMGFIKARMSERHNPWILTSASVRTGRPFNSILVCTLLGLHSGDYHLIRRSCARPDVQILQRTLISPISGDSFPELDSVLLDKRPTIIFPKSFSLASRIYAYLVRMANSDNPNLVRMYSSLNFDSHNAETRELLKAVPTDADYCQIVIGTDSLSVGVGMPARLDAIIIGDVEDCDDFIQKLGRVGRTKTAGAQARVIFYVTPAARVLAEKAIVYDETGICKAGEALPEISIARLIVSKCKVAEIDRLYDNPPSDVPCTCSLCSTLPPASRPSVCNCSGCIPETLPPITRPPRVSKINSEIPPSQRLSKIQRAHGTKRLLSSRLEIWKAADQAKFWMFAPVVFLPDAVIISILDNFVLLDSLKKVTRFVKPSIYLAEHAKRLFDLLVQLSPEFKQIATDRKAENAANLKAKKAAESAEAVALKPDSSGENSDDTDGDVVMNDLDGLRDVTTIAVNVPKLPTKPKRSVNAPKVPDRAAPAAPPSRYGTRSTTKKL